MVRFIVSRRHFLTLHIVNKTLLYTSGHIFPYLQSAHLGCGAVQAPVATESARAHSYYSVSTGMQNAQGGAVPF